MKRANKKIHKDDITTLELHVCSIGNKQKDQEDDEGGLQMATGDTRMFSGN